MKTYGEVAFLTSPRDGGEWSGSRPGRFTPGERTLGTPWIGSQMGPRASLDAVENTKILHLSGIEPCRNTYWAG
jgi:hypothetical protein